MNEPRSISFVTEAIDQMLLESFNALGPQKRKNKGSAYLGTWKLVYKFKDSLRVRSP